MKKEKLNIYIEKEIEYKKTFRDLRKIHKYLSKDQEHKFVETSLWIVDSKRIKELNNEHRSKNQVTDVLSFPHNELEEGRIYLGDIFINEDIIVSQSKEVDSEPKIEMKFLFLHGLLHLYGYDHIDDNDYKLMNTKQREVFRALGIRDDKI